MNIYISTEWDIQAHAIFRLAVCIITNINILSDCEINQANVILVATRTRNVLNMVCAVVVVAHFAL